MAKKYLLLILGKREHCCTLHLIIIYHDDAWKWLTNNSDIYKDASFNDGGLYKMIDHQEWNQMNGTNNLILLYFPDDDICYGLNQWLTANYDACIGESHQNSSKRFCKKIAKENNFWSIDIKKSNQQLTNRDRLWLYSPRDNLWQIMAESSTIQERHQSAEYEGW